jgi:hypothetical protein
MEGRTGQTGGLTSPTACRGLDAPGWQHWLTYLQGMFCIASHFSITRPFPV